MTPARASLNPSAPQTEALRSRQIISPAERPVLLSPRAILSSLFSFEALLVLYLFAGLYKGDPRFAWIPVDPTGLFFALSVVVGSFIIVRNPISKRKCVIVFAMLAFVAWWAVTLMWSPSKIYGPTKVFFMATLVLWALISGALVVGPNPERVRRLFTLLLLFSIWVAIEALLLYSEDPLRLFILVGSGNYLALGRSGGLGALIAFIAWLFERRLGFVKVMFLGLFASLTFVMLIGGGRGPLLATLVPVLFALLFGLQVTRRRILYRRWQISVVVLVTGLVTGLAIYMVATDRIPQSLQRLQTMFVRGEFRGSAANRVQLYDDVFVKFWPAAPLLGNGAGSWPVLRGGLDDRDYPHNLVLEVLVEAGIVGLILLVILFAIALRPLSLERLRNDPLALCVFLLFLNAVLNAMVSGDLPDNRVMFMLLGLLTASTTRGSALDPDRDDAPRPLPLTSAAHRGPGMAPLLSARGKPSPRAAPPQTSGSRKRIGTG